MKLYLNSEECEIIERYSLFKDIYCSMVIPSNSTPYLYVTGSQVRLIIERMFEIIWQDRVPYDDKFWLSQFGQKLTRDAL